MPLGRHVCHLHHRIKNSGDYIWISDKALDHAIQRFSHIRISRRHVGLAPGPLEARKRASKRRMMNLAQAGDGAPPEFDLFPWTEIPPQNGWQWQSPSPALLNERKRNSAKLVFLGLTAC